MKRGTADKKAFEQIFRENFSVPKLAHKPMFSTKESCTNNLRFFWAGVKILRMC